MIVKQIVISLVVVAVVQLLIAYDFVLFARLLITQRILMLGNRLLCSRVFPDGLISIGALLIIRDYAREQLDSVVRFVRSKVTG